jgi:hypothetical protein
MKMRTVISDKPQRKQIPGLIQFAVQSKQNSLSSLQQ